MTKTYMRCIILSFGCLLCACTITTTKIDDEKDKQQAEMIIEKLYKYRKANEFNKIYTLFSPEYYKVGDTSSLFDDFSNITKTNGEIQNIKLISYKAKITRGSKNSGYLNLKYILSNQKSNWVENYILSLQQDGNFKIYLYDLPNRLK